MKLKLLTAFIVGMSYVNLSYAVMAVEPVINKNVHVLKNVSPSQCPSSWRGNPGTTNIGTDSAMGMGNSMVASGVSSCTGCAFDQASGDCVCRACYENFN